MDARENVLVDSETTEEEARDLLDTLLRDGFDDEIDLLAQALGRPTAEIQNIFKGEEGIDEDLLMKARGLAQERNLKIR
jgi:hypothetical protein